jgi:tryptophan-rich sensory protein
MGASDWVSLGVFAALVVAAAFFGGQWGANAWYATLSKPSFTPPNWLFPIAWTVLYFMIAVAGWLVWQKGGPEANRALIVWAAQLIPNAIWSYVFFGRQEIGAALIVLLVMWALIALFIVLAWPVDRRASLLFVPYFIWVSYAGVLNYVILKMNPAV